MSDRCIESRVQKDGFRVRRYERPDGTRYSTIEVPLRVWESVSTKKRVASSARAAERIAKRERAQELIRRGFSVAEVCRMLDAPLTTVYSWRDQMPERTPRPGRSVFDLTR